MISKDYMTPEEIVQNLATLRYLIVSAKGVIEESENSEAITRLHDCLQLLATIVQATIGRNAEREIMEQAFREIERRMAQSAAPKTDQIL
jgi:hypothetical protein